MIKIGVLLSLVILAAALAATASAALAAKYEQSQHKYPAKLEEKAIVPAVFKVEGLSVKCNKATLTGTLAEASEKVNVVPRYEECTAGVGEVKSAATIKVLHCEYQSTLGGLLKTVKEGNEEAGKEVKEFSAKGSLVSEKGGICEMVIETKALGTCITTIGPQNDITIGKEKSKHKWFPFEWETESETETTAEMSVSKGCVVIKEGVHKGTLEERTTSGLNFEIN